MTPPAGPSPLPPNRAGDWHEPLRRLLVGRGWPWVVVWLLSRGWMLSRWATDWRYCANDVHYYFTQLAQPGGYQAVLREYPLPVVWVLDLLRRPVAGDTNLYLVLFAVTMAVLDAGFSVWLWHRHSRVASIYWMAYVFCMGPLVWFRYDLLAGVVVGAAAFLVLRHPARSGALVALGAGLKLWPALLAAALVGRGRASSARLRAFLGTGLLLAGTALLVAGPSRLVSPLTWQKDRGLQVESVWATWPVISYHRASTPGVTTHEVQFTRFNAYEVFGPHVQPLLTMASLTMALGVLFALAVAVLAWRRGDVEPQTRALAMVAIVVFMIDGNKALSPQYMSWLGPVVAAWLGLASPGAARARAAGVALVTLLLAALTAQVYPGHYQDVVGAAHTTSPTVVALVVRNLGLVLLCPVLCLWTVRDLRPSRRFAPVTVGTDTIDPR